MSLITSPIKNSEGTKDGNKIVFTAETNADVFSPADGKVISGTPNNYVIIKLNNNYNVKLNPFKVTIENEKNVDNTSKIGTTTDTKIYVELTDDRDQPLNANDYYSKTSLADNQETGSLYGDTVNALMGRQNESVKLEINRIRQLLK